MLVDIGEVKRYIKPKADSTLRNMRKDELIEYIRCLEHNYNVAVSFNENQAKYIESLNVAEVVHGRWEETLVPCGYTQKRSRTTKKCSACGWTNACRYNYCPNCGAKMDGERKDNESNT